MIELTSTANPRIREAIALQEKSALRRKSGLFVVEGVRETAQALAAGIRLQALFVTEAAAASPDSPVRACELAGTSVYRVSGTVYAKLAYRGGTEGILAVARTPEHRPEDLKLTDNPLVIVLESVEKPGNLGAVLRTADAVGADAVLVCDPLTDLYNPNVIRSSLGGIFTVPVCALSSEEAAGWISRHGLKILTAQLQDSELYYDTDMTCGCALVMGTESTGLTDFWRRRSDARIRIPMLGRLDSLNVSVSTAILCYEALRQRRARQQ